MSVNNAIEIRELTAQEMQLLYPLVEQLNDDLEQEQFTIYLADMLENRYRCVGAWGEGKLLGAMGFWVSTRFWTGKFLEIDNVVTDEAARGRGIGAKLAKWVDEEAERLGCSRVIAAVYTRNNAAHRFYARERYDILGFYFTKKLR